MTPQERLTLLRLVDAYVKTAILAERNSEKSKRMAVPKSVSHARVEEAKTEFWNYLGKL